MIAIFLCLFSFLLLLGYVGYLGDYFYDNFGFAISMVCIPIIIVQIPTGIFLISTGKQIYGLQRYLLFIIPSSFMLLVVASIYMMLQDGGF